MKSFTSNGLTPNSLSCIASKQPLRAVGEQKRSGLILCKAHYAEFAGPGAGIYDPFQQGYSQIIAIGDPELIAVTTHEERQKAYGHRIQWVRWLHKIVSQTDPSQRVEKLFSGFEEFFGGSVLTQISDEVLAVLVGVLPSTIAQARSQRRYLPSDRSSQQENSEDLDVRVLTLNWNDLVKLEAPTIRPVPTNFAEALDALPCSA